ncbi:hypothetical protein OPT61_g4925 [Boeremia exigua]|uniref:Uncharacterized protein n=1 Tax=Boeremia exigua TaxID=749465 RepID=A0ACC2IC60_9PLEO|nr:hypothetical protein OPT61_g4925 [Boeremia exigua]
MDRKQTRPEVREHIPIIAAELAEVIPSNQMAQFSIVNANTRKTRTQVRVEARILQLASTVVNSKYKAKMYSNFHEWEAFRNISTKASAHDLAPSLVTSMHPFGNCLTMASECFEELRAALAAEGPAYATYVDRVQLVTNNWKQQTRSSRDYHCITILRMATHCIILDAVACATAFIVPLDELYKLPNCSSAGFMYIASGDARLLVEYWPHLLCCTLARPQSEALFEYDDPYADIRDGLAGAVQNLTYPSVNWHVRGELPSRRITMMQKTLDCKPSNANVLFEELEDKGGFVVETGQIRVDFNKRKITVKYIPCDRVVLPPCKGAFAKFKILLANQGPDSFDEETIRNLNLMNEMCEHLGMPEGEVLRMAGVVLGVLAEHDERIGKQTGRRRKNGVPKTAAEQLYAPNGLQRGNLKGLQQGGVRHETIRGSTLRVCFGNQHNTPSLHISSIDRTPAFKMLSKSISGIALLVVAMLAPVRSVILDA